MSGQEELDLKNPSVRRAVRKNRFKSKLEEYIQVYKNILVVGIDNVGSNQMQKVRLALRGKAVMLMGKNTMMRKFLEVGSASNPALSALLPLIRGNVGLVFTNDDLSAIRKTITENKVPAAAKTGVNSPCDIVVPKGPTGLDPGQTSFFQALQIPTKINKGSIELTDDFLLVKKNEKVTASAVALLTKLNIKPFSYGIQVLTVYENGSIYAASVLDLSQDDLLNTFFGGVRYLAALGLQIGFPCAATLPHNFAAGFKYLLAISLATDYTFEESKTFKEYLANPDAFKSAAAAAAPAAAAAAEEAPEEKEEEEDGDMGFSLFD